MNQTKNYTEAAVFCKDIDENKRQSLKKEKFQPILRF